MKDLELIRLQILEYLLKTHFFPFTSSRQPEHKTSRTDRYTISPTWPIPCLIYEHSSCQMQFYVAHWQKAKPFYNLLLDSERAFSRPKLAQQRALAVLVVLCQKHQGTPWWQELLDGICTARDVLWGPWGSASTGCACLCFEAYGLFVVAGAGQCGNRWGRE